MLLVSSAPPATSWPRGPATNIPTDAAGVRAVLRLKEAQASHERRADDRVAANTDAARLADARLREERHHFVGQCSGTRDEADAALAEDVVWHDADFAGARRRQSWAVRADQSCGVLLQEGHDPRHVEHGNILGDAHDELDPRSGR